MLSTSDISLFLNKRFIDKLWIRVTRDGLSTERLEEASNKIAAKFSVTGLGKLWHQIDPDIGAVLDLER
jgi:hypothetical protein